MSMPRYTCIESTLKISAPLVRATSIATADLPDAGGPRMTSIGGVIWNLPSRHRRQVGCQNCRNIGELAAELQVANSLKTLTYAIRPRRRSGTVFVIGVMGDPFGNFIATIAKGVKRWHFQHE